jgi:hypothetical protein
VETVTLAAAKPDQDQLSLLACEKPPPFPLFPTLVPHALAAIASSRQYGSWWTAMLICTHKAEGGDVQSH